MRNFADPSVHRLSYLRVKENGGALAYASQVALNCICVQNVQRNFFPFADSCHVFCDLKCLQDLCSVLRTCFLFDGKGFSSELQ